MDTEVLSSSIPVSPPTAPSARWRVRIRIGLIGMVLIAVAGAIGWWDYHSTRPAYRLRLGQDFIIRDKSLSTVGKRDPTDGKPFDLMGTIYKDLDHHQEALEAFAEALRRYEVLPRRELPTERLQEVRTDLADTLIQRGQYARALEVLEDAT